jgi:hypothetical protein
VLLGVPLLDASVTLSGNARVSLFDDLESASTSVRERRTAGTRVAIFEPCASVVDVMSGSWRLIRPGRRYVPPAASDDPIAIELRSLAQRDLAAGRTLGDWSDDERERLLGDRRGQRALMAFYEPVRWPDRVSAPPAVTDDLEQQARRRSAARLGLTPESLPGRAGVNGSLFVVLLTLAQWVWRRLHGETLPGSTPWSMYLATRLVTAVDERRSWRRALRH